MAHIFANFSVTAPMFHKYPKIKTPAKHYVQQATYNVIYTFISNNAGDIIKATKRDGARSIKLLTKHYATVTSGNKARFNIAFASIRQQSNESALNYIKRFNVVRRMAVSVGNKYCPDTLVDMFLNGIVTGSKYEIQKLDCQADRRKGETLSLSIIETLFIAIDAEQYLKRETKPTVNKIAAKHVSCNFCKKQGHSESDCYKKKMLQGNNKSNGNSNNNQPPKDPCFKCGKVGHWSKEYKAKEKANATKDRVTISRKVKAMTKDKCVSQSSLNPKKRWQT